jgi:hypothetical protein
MCHVLHQHQDLHGSNNTSEANLAAAESSQKSHPPVISAQVVNVAAQSSTQKIVAQGQLVH